MPEALKCPSCSAPLDYPPGGGATMHCPYCNTTVMIPGNPPASTPDIDLTAFGPLIGKAMQMSQVADLLRQGKKIQAIKIIRETHGVDLASAKAAVDHLASGRSPGFGGTSPATGYSSTVITTTPGSLKFGCGLASSIALVVGIIAFSVVRSIRNQMAANAPIPAPTIFTIPALPVIPPASTFAHVALEFGAEGIGAGQFKDSRSVAIDGAGHIYVGEFSDGRVQVFDPQGKFLAMWSIGRNKSLMNLTADLHGTVYAVIPFKIFRYEGLTGMPLGEMESTHDDVQEDYSDAYAALNGDIYAVTNNSDIVILGPDGHIKSFFNGSQKVGEDVSLERIAVLPTGEIYALDPQKGIFKFAADGRYINRFGSVADTPTPGHLFSPHNIAVDGKGRIYVSDSETAVNVFDPDGIYLDCFGGTEVVFGFAINNQNEIFASMRNLHVVRKFVLDKP
jgi:LSD1 subclass zinc finger protein